MLRPIGEPRGTRITRIVRWTQVVERAPFFRDGIVAEQLEEIRKQLLPIRINQWREVAKEAHSKGDWEQEIKAWQQVLHLNPRLREARTCLQHAKQHLRYVQLYQDTEQFVQDHQNDAARELLRRIWSEDSYYGDPGSLAHILKVCVPLSYQEEQQREKQEIQRKTLLLEAYGPDCARPRVVPIAAWCSILGAGLTSIGITQSWIVAILTLLMMALAGWGMGYRRILSRHLLAGLLLSNMLLTSIVALLLSIVNYQQPYTGSFLQTTYTGPQATQMLVRVTWHIWPQSQIICGTLFGILFPVTVAILVCWSLPPITLLSFSKTRGKIPSLYIRLKGLRTLVCIVGGIWGFIFAIALSFTQSDVGFGSDAGVPMLLLGLASGLLLGSGLAISLPLWCTVLRLWIETRSK